MNLDHNRESDTYTTAQSPLTRAAYTVQRIDTLDELETIRTAWETLLAQNLTQTAELTYLWQVTYWEHFPDRSELFVLVVRDGATVVGIAPLRLRRIRPFGIPLRRLEFIAAAESNYQDFIIGSRREDVLACIWAYLDAQRAAWDVLLLWHVPDHSPTAVFFRQKLAAGFLGRVEAETCAMLPIDTTWEAYAAATADWRKKAAYRVRKLQRLAGTLRDFACTPEQFPAYMAEFMAQHCRRWNATQTPSQFNDPRQRAFYLDAGEKLLRANNMALYVLEAGGRPVGMLFAFVYAGVYLQQLTCFETDYAKASPSVVLHELFVQELFAQGAKGFDFGHYYPYKDMWATKTKQRLNTTLYARHGLRSRLVFALYGIIQFLRRFIRDNPRLLRLARGIRVQLKRLAGSSVERTP